MTLLEMNWKSKTIFYKSIFQFVKGWIMMTDTKNYLPENAMDVSVGAGCEICKVVQFLQATDTYLIRTDVEL